MTTLVYFVAQSLDGYIAGPAGEMDWLQSFDAPGEDHGYADFIADIDGLVMGRDTYEVMRGFGVWPYGEKPCWVMTHREATSFGDLPPGVQLTHQRPSLIATRWEALGLKRVWMVGGGQVASQFAHEGLLDELVLATAPVMLGAGRRLFAEGGFEPQRYTLQGSKRYDSGIVVSTLTRGEPPPVATAPEASATTGAVDLDNMFGARPRDPRTQHDTEPFDL